MNKLNWVLGGALALTLVVFGGLVVWHLHSADSDPTVSLPSTANVAPGKFLKLSAQTNCGSVKWFSSCGAENFIQLGAKDIIFVSPTQGTFRVVAYGAKGNKASDPAICDITVGSTPGPNPPPNPPPAPPDAFTQSLITAYAADTAADKAVKLIQLQSLWTKFATTTVNDSTITTVGQMLSVLHDAAQGMLGDSLKGVRDTISKELNGKLPTKADQVLDATSRQTMATQFQRVADDLKSVSSQR